MKPTAAHVENLLLPRPSVTLKVPDSVIEWPNGHDGIHLLCRNCGESRHLFVFLFYFVFVFALCLSKESL
ncbi:hypothetical protein BDV32DRAFT_119282 [Aspergillus pseudonomiae]|nr:hypothetical protein BDV32DRAFT_119282 [Aspergillus pseudonomiae]